jgi:hypothetical protein
MTSADVATSPAQNTVTLPNGARLGVGRETAQANRQGQVVQGMIFPITLPSGTSTSVFVPYSLLEDPSAVQALFTTRIQALAAIGA